MSESSFCSSETSRPIQYDASISSSDFTSILSLKARVLTVDPNNGRCLLENSPAHCGVDLVHCFPKQRAEDEEFMTNLEYHWNIPRGSLNLDTRYNAFAVRPHLCQVFANSRDSGLWILVPEDRIVDQYYNHVTNDKPRSEFPVIKDETFLYRFFCIGKEQSIVDLAITRQEEASDPAKQPHCTVHVHPFESMPLVRSHLHPKFAILEAGRKLNGSMAVALIYSLLDRHLVLKRLCSVYASWIHPCRDYNFLHSKPRLRHDCTKTNATETESVDSAKYTPPPLYRSVWKGQISRRKISGRSQTSMCSGGYPRKRRRYSSDLSVRTLREHVKIVGKQEWKPALVREWLEQCQPLEDQEISTLDALTS